MSEISNFEAMIRKIVKDELKDQDLIGPHAKEFQERRKAAKREGTAWSVFETEMLSDSFRAFCVDRALKTGRSIKSISCKIRRMMYEKIIPTWEDSDKGIAKW